MGAVDTIEWACVLHGHHIQNDWVEQQIWNKFCVKLEYFSMKTIWMIQKATAMSKWWLAASSWQCAYSCIISHAEFIGETSNYPGDSAPLQTRFGTLWLLAFSKLKSPLKGKRYQTIDEIQTKYDGTADGDWQSCVKSQGAYFEGDPGILVLYTVFLVSCICFNKCL